MADSETLIITSHSIDGTFDSCPRRFEFMHMYLKLSERDSDSYAADVGTALHEATQAWQTKLVEGASDSAARAYGMLTLVKFWPWQQERDRMKKDPVTNRVKGIGERTLGNAALLLERIYNNPLWQEWELVTVEGFGPAIEVPWRIVHESFGEVDMPYGKKGVFATQGKSDFILRHRHTGKYRILDLKTTAKSFPAHNASFRFSGQAGQYGMILAHAIGLDWQKEGLDVIYLIAFFGDYEHEIDVYPIEYHLDPEEVQDAIDVKLERLTRMKRYAEQKHWPRTSHGCDFWNSACSFLDICQRRDQKFVESWFEFEKAAGRFTDYDRVYEPVWELVA